MTDIILSSFLSLFALFGKEEQVDETWAKAMLVSYLRHHFGIRNIDVYLDLYSDMRGAYEMTDDLDSQVVVEGICKNLHGKISSREESLLLLRLMEFCGNKEAAAPPATGKGGAAGGALEPAHKGKGHSTAIFKTIAQQFNIPEKQFKDFTDFVAGHETKHVMQHRLDDTDGQLKTLLDPTTGMLLFTYTGKDTVLLNDVPVLTGTYQVWLQSSVLKGKGGKPV